MKESECLEGTTTQEIAGLNVKLSYSCCNSDLCNSFDAAKKAAEQQAVATTTQSANPTESVSTAKATTRNHASSDRSSFVFICFVSSFFLYYLV